MAVDNRVRDGVVIETHQKHPASGKWNPRLVERDMAPAAHPDHLKADSAGPLDLVSVGIQDVRTDPAEVFRSRVAPDHDRLSVEGSLLPPVRGVGAHL